MLRAPEGTFGAAVSEVGVHDLLKVSVDMWGMFDGWLTVS